MLSQTFQAFDVFGSLRTKYQIYSRMPLYWNLFDVFLIISLRFQCGGRSARLSAIFITGTCWPRDWCCPCSPAAAVYHVSLLWSSFFYPPFHTVLFRRKPLCTTHTKGMGCYAPSTLEWNLNIIYLEFFYTGGLFVLPIYLYVQLFVCISYNITNLMLHCIGAQTVWAVADRMKKHSELNK